jgi:hypothetical protein
MKQATLISKVQPMRSGDPFKGIQENLEKGKFDVFGGELWGSTFKDIYF